jgi:hypothetical protein
MRSQILIVVIACFLALSYAQVDQDGDGFYTSSIFPHLIDCCDSVANCPNPYLVNPAAQEILGNGIDDNCDLLVDQIEVCPGNIAPTSPVFTFSTASATAQIMPTIAIYSCSSGDDVNWGY